MLKQTFPGGQYLDTLTHLTLYAIGKTVWKRSRADVARKTREEDVRRDF